MVVEKEKENKRSSVNKIKVTQLGSCIGRKYDQEQTMIGLGLNKRHKSVILDETPAILGMVKKVQHLLKVEKHD